MSTNPLKNTIRVNIRQSLKNRLWYEPIRSDQTLERWMRQDEQEG